MKRVVLFIAVLLGLCLPAWAVAPLVILATGQSNISVTRSYTWTPAANLSVWNLVQQGADTDVGTAFSAPGNNISMGLAFAERIARDNTDRPVYLMNVGWGGVSISQWLPGASSPDLFKQVDNNVAAALAVIGVSHIDVLLWWQGENDAIYASSTYPQDFDAVIARFQTKSWFEEGTPTIIMGLSPYADAVSPLVALFGNTLRQTAARAPAQRTFVSLRGLPQGDWEATENYIHMTGPGYYAAGGLAYDAFRSGANSGPNYGPVRLVKTTSDIRTSTTTLADDRELKVYIRAGKTYRLNGNLIGLTTATADLKWSLTGPSFSIVDCEDRTIPHGATTETLEHLSALPANKTVLGSVTGDFRIGFDCFLYSAAADGVVKLQWAQNTSDASSAYMFLGSTIDVQEVPGQN